MPHKELWGIFYLPKKEEEEEEEEESKLISATLQ